MERIIEVKINGNQITKDSNNAGTKGEGNITILRIEFDEGWDGFAKTVTFLDAFGQNPVERMLTADLLEDITLSTRIYLVPIPAEPLAEAGLMAFMVDGYSDGTRQRSISDTLEVLDALDVENASEPEDITPSQAEHLQAQIDSILDRIQSMVIAAATSEKNAQKAADAVAGFSGDLAPIVALVEGHAKDAEESHAEADLAARRAEDAQLAAEKARDEASDIAGGNFISEEGARQLAEKAVRDHEENHDRHVSEEDRLNWDNKMNNNLRGQSNGVAPLDEAGVLPTDYLPEIDAEHVGAAKAPVYKLVTIPASGWTDTAPYTVTILVEGILNTDTPVPGVMYADDIETAKAQRDAWGKVDRIQTQDGSIKVYCFDDIPSADIPVQLKVVR